MQNRARKLVRGWIDRLGNRRPRHRQEGATNAKTHGWVGGKPKRNEDAGWRQRWKRVKTKAEVENEAKTRPTMPNTSGRRGETESDELERDRTRRKTIGRNAAETTSGRQVDDEDGKLEPTRTRWETRWRG